jgi:hypothetical protein
MSKSKKESAPKCEHDQEKKLVFSCNVFHNGVEYKKGEEFIGEPSEELKKFLE